MRILPKPDQGDAPARPQTALALAALGIAALAWLGLGLPGARPAAAGVSYAVIQTYPNPTPAPDEEFGSALAWLPGSGQILVGARGDQLDMGQHVGAAYLVNAGTGAVDQVFAKPTPMDADFFGFSVAAAITNVVVGAPNDELGGAPQNYGVVYLFDSASGALVHTFPHPTPAANDLFGSSVAIAGDTLVVGAPQYNAPSAVDAGRVFLCGLQTGTCPGIVDNPSPGTTLDGDRFGLVVAATTSRFAVAAPYDGGHGTVYVYTYSGSTATLTRAISETLQSTGDEFGRALAAVGNNLLIGAPADDAGANNAGAAYLYDLNGSLLHTFINPAPHENDRFGSAVASDGTLIAIGAANDDAGGDDAGAVHLYDGSTYAFIQTVQKQNRQAGEQFGFALAAIGADFVSGALHDNSGAASSGAMYRIGVSTLAGGPVYLPLIFR
ncbi:MAG: hypothetical protein IT318_18930 [Anaerolineales bacterium]|nr:hypothetical protein [Anaerolineales bacterium]